MATAPSTAPAIARSTSSTVACGTVAIKSPSKGLRTSNCLRPLIHSPCRYIFIENSLDCGTQEAVAYAASIVNPYPESTPALDLRRSDLTCPGMCDISCVKQT